MDKLKNDILDLVLIVAKCIVNISNVVFAKTEKGVLIVAKCIVNFSYIDKGTTKYRVLIVAKCIVNIIKLNSTALDILY